jgi:hypothetical protein
MSAFAQMATGQLSGLTAESEARLVAELKKQAEGLRSAARNRSCAGRQNMTFKRMIRHRKGRFPVLPERVVESSRE